MVSEDEDLFDDVSDSADEARADADSAVQVIEGEELDAEVRDAMYDFLRNGEEDLA
jgi:hypothetical protein